MLGVNVDEVSAWLLLFFSQWHEFSNDFLAGFICLQKCILLTNLPRFLFCRKQQTVNEASWKDEELGDEVGREGGRDGEERGERDWQMMMDVGLVQAIKSKIFKIF